jgi:hypothetical protein
VVGEGRRRGVGEELEGEGRHLEETDSEDSSWRRAHITQSARLPWNGISEEEREERSQLTLGVSTHTQTIDEPSSHSNDVLERSRERDSRDVLDAVHSEHGRLKDGVPGGSGLGVGRADGGLAELGVGDLEGDVGST